MKYLSLWRGVIEVNTMRAIIEDVARRSELTVAELRGPGRARRYSWPRFEAMYLMREADHSLAQIGKFLGGRDHTTVLHGCRRYEAWLTEGIP